MRALARLSAGSPEASASASLAILDVLRRARQGSNTIAHALAYECLRAAARLSPPSRELLGECTRTVGFFLRPSAPPNLKYAGIHALVRRTCDGEECNRVRCAVISSLPTADHLHTHLHPHPRSRPSSPWATSTPRPTKRR